MDGWMDGWMDICECVCVCHVKELMSQKIVLRSDYLFVYSQLGRHIHNFAWLANLVSS